MTATELQQIEQDIQRLQRALDEQKANLENKRCDNKKFVLVSPENSPQMILERLEKEHAALYQECSMEKRKLDAFLRQGEVLKFAALNADNRTSEAMWKVSTCKLNEPSRANYPLPEEIDDWRKELRSLEAAVGRSIEKGRLVTAQYEGWRSQRPVEIARFDDLVGREERAREKIAECRRNMGKVQAALAN